MKLICAFMLFFLSSNVLAESTFYIRYERTEGKSDITGHGTAFQVDLSKYFNDKNTLLTAAHNVLSHAKVPYSDIYLFDKVTKKKTPVKVLAYSKDIDLAIVQPIDGQMMGVPFKLDESTPNLNEPVLLIGFPKGEGPITSKGTLKSYFLPQNGPYASNTGLSVAQLDYFNHGNSGGPLIRSSNNKVIGIAVAGIPDPNDDLQPNKALSILVPLIKLFLAEVSQGAIQK